MLLHQPDHGGVSFRRARWGLDVEVDLHWRGTQVLVLVVLFQLPPFRFLPVALQDRVLNSLARRWFDEAVLGDRPRELLPRKAVAVQVLDPVQARDALPQKLVLRLDVQFPLQAVDLPPHHRGLVDQAALVLVHVLHGNQLRVGLRQRVVHRVQVHDPLSERVVPLVPRHQPQRKGRHRPVLVVVHVKLDAAQLRQLLRNVHVEVQVPARRLRLQQRLGAAQLKNCGVVIDPAHHHVRIRVRYVLERIHPGFSRPAVEGWQKTARHAPTARLRGPR
mmetsp:Transcript_4933/g.12321  ORF Transcript_4933/g.12321 Transcript_4933/m.12321 type:complete len:276 (-) Transcript_4933:1838-2665(-)